MAFTTLKEKISTTAQLISFDLDGSWNSQWLIVSLREALVPLLEKKMAESDIPFDPQDLEHQTLFYLTTFNPGEITEEVIAAALEEQYMLVRERLLAFSNKEELEYLFRGLKGFYPDLNTHHRLNLKRDGDRLYAVGEGRTFDVEFKKLEDEKIISLFTGALHYIHHERTEGDAFALYFKGDKFPWAVETTERGTLAREYKRGALASRGFDPDKTIELTRFYTLPGAPKNAISAMDRLVKRYYEGTGMEAMFTCTMPAYSKTKSTTIAGGINKVLCVKDLKHYFVAREVDGRTCWQHVSRRWLEVHGEGLETKTTDPGFRLLPVVDVYLPLKTSVPETAQTQIPYFRLPAAACGCGATV